MKRISLIILSFVVLFGLVLRVWDLGDSPMWIDEIYTVNGAQAVLDNGYPILDSGELYTNTFLSVYISAGIMKLVDVDPMNPWPLRLPAAIFGTLSIIALFIWVKKLFKREDVALAAAFLMSFSYWEIAWSRQIRGYELCTFFAITACIFLYRYIESKRGRDAALLVLSLAVAAISHWVALVFILPFAICIFFSHRFSHTPEISSVVLKWISVTSLITFATSIFIYQVTSPLGSGLKNMLGESWLLICFAAVGIFLATRSKESHRTSLILISSTLASFSIMMFFTEPVYSRYLFAFIPVLFIYVAYGAINVFPVNASKAFSVGLLIIPSLFICHFTPMSFYELEKDSPQPDFKDVFSLIQDSIQPDDIVMSVYPVVQKVFLGNLNATGDRNFWLPLSIGSRNTERLKAKHKTDFYVNAPSIGDVSMIAKIAETKNGFLIADPATKKLLSMTSAGVDFLENSELIYETNKYPYDGLWVYRF